MAVFLAVYLAFFFGILSGILFGIYSDIYLEVQQHPTAIRSWRGGEEEAAEEGAESYLKI